MSRTIFGRVGAWVIAGGVFAGGAGAEEPSAGPQPAASETTARDASAAERAAQALTHYRDALEAEAAGEVERARRAFEAVVAADPEHRAARRALGYEKVEGRWVTREEARALADAAVRAAAAPTSTTLASTAPTVAVPSVQSRVREALTATDAAARVEAIAALKSAAPDVARSSFEQALRRSDGATRVRAAEALGLLGDERSAAALLDAWLPRAPAGVRGHFAQTAQRTYIADYDVEVA